MKNIKNILRVTKSGDYAFIDIKNNNGTVVTVRRKFRVHSAEIRELQKQGIYCFEIQGILYWYQLVDEETGWMVKYKEPEDFRSEERTTGLLRKKSSDGVERKHKTYKTKVEKGSVELELKVEEEPKQEVEEQKEEENKPVQHKEYNTIKTCIENNIPVYLVGEAGTGKNYTLESIAWDLELDFYFTNSVQQEYKLTGFIDAGGTYHETEFYKAFTKGGLFFLDEMDASIPEVLVLLNAAIANGYFEFPNGRKEAHKDFRVVAAGNTVGSGADELYTGRLVLDQATLDRFVIIEFDYDRNVELHLANNNTELVDFVEKLRKQSRENGMRCTFSYRCIIQVTKLEQAGMDIKTILQIAVFKGMNKDTINQFSNTAWNNRYFKTMEELQRAA